MSTLKERDKAWTGQAKKRPPHEREPEAGELARLYRMGAWAPDSAS